MLKFYGMRVERATAMRIRSRIDKLYEGTALK